MHKDKAALWIMSNDLLAGQDPPAHIRLVFNAEA
jgi:hypothetical protein